MSLDISKLAQSALKPVVAGTVSAALVAILQEPASSEVFGYQVPLAAAVGVVVAVGSLITELSANYVIPMLNIDALGSTAIYILQPALTGGLAVGVDFFFNGSSEGMFMTFMAGFAGQLIAGYAISAFDFRGGISKFI